MSDQLRRFGDWTLDDLGNVTFSPESADGHSRSEWPASQTMNPCGPDHALASRSALPESAEALTTNAICGLNSIASSPSAALQASLANRLPALLDSHGSTMFALTWKMKATPLRRQICQLAARAHPTKDSACSGWLTPRARGDAGGKRWRDRLAKNLEDQARIYALMRGLTDTEVARLSLSATFVRRLMGYPTAWDDCAPTETRSSRSSRRRS